MTNETDKCITDEITWIRFWGTHEYVSELQKLRNSVNIPLEDVQIIEKMFVSSVEDLVQSSVALLNELMKGKKCTH